jgi:hypothetical protein
MDDLVKKYSSEIKGLLSDEKNQRILLIAGAAYLLSKEDKERNAILAGLAGAVLLPEATNVTLKK